MEPLTDDDLANLESLTNPTPAAHLACRAIAELERLRAELQMSEARRELVTAAYERAIKIVEVGPHAAAKREAKELSDSARTLQELQGMVERLRAELLQQPPTLEWLRETFGEPDKPGEAETWWGDYLSWTHQWSHCYTGPYNNRRFWKTRAAVLAAVDETKGASDGK